MITCPDFVLKTHRLLAGNETIVWGNLSNTDSTQSGAIFNDVMNVESELRQEKLCDQQSTNGLHHTQKTHKELKDNYECESTKLNESVYIRPQTENQQYDAIYNQHRSVHES